MDLGIKNKVAIVAASSKGLGKSSAKALAAEGVKVVICSRNQKDIEETAQEIQSQTKGECLPLVADVSKQSDIESLVKHTIDYWGGVDILVNNAGGPPAMTFDQIADQQFNEAFNTNFMSAIRLIRLCLPSMKNNQWGRIINITSVSVKQPLPNLMLSNAVRCGVIGFAKTLADEIGPYNITVNNLCPGYTRTDRVINLADNLSKQQKVGVDKIYAQWEKSVPLGRIGDPDDFGACVAFIASQQAGYITGTSITVDGGFYRGVM